MRPGEPYPATFRMSVDPPRVELGSPPRQGGVFPLDHEPVYLVTCTSCLSVDLMGVEPTPPTLQGSVAPNGMQALGLLSTHFTTSPLSAARTGIEPVSRD